MKKIFSKIKNCLLITLLIITLLPAVHITASAANDYEAGFPLPVTRKYAASALAQYTGGSPHRSYLYTFGPVKTQAYNEYCLVDIPASSDTPIYAVASGTIYTNTYKSGGGYFLVIKHDDGSYSYYGHMKSRSEYAVGTRVNAGTVVGYVGNTGKVSNKDKGGGYHLHFEWSGHDPYCEYTKKEYITSMQSPAKDYPHQHGEPVVKVITGAADTLTETSAILRGSFTVSGGRASECGMYLGTSANDTPWLGSDVVNTNGTSMFYSTSKYGRTLQPGTTYWYQAYAIVNGTKYCGKLESFITPGTAKIEPTPVEGKLSINKSHMTMKVGTCDQITATTTPAGQAVSWESTNPDVATVSNGVVTANKPGTTTINVSMNYGGTYYLSLCSVTVEAAAPAVESTPAVDLSVSGVTNLSQNSARVNASCSYSNGDRPNAVGLYLGTSSSAMSFYKSDEGINHNKNPFDIWYNLSGLSAGTTYYYQFYATIGNKTVWSSVNSFTTTAAPVQVSNTRSAVVVNTNGQYLAINNAPAASPKYSQQIGRIPPGGTVTVYPDKTSGNWYYVEYNGVSGYAYNKYLALQ